MPGAGEYFTSPLLIQYRKHYTRESFEVAPMADDYEAILPNWWLTAHQPLNFLSRHNKRLSFSSSHCQRNCTKD